MASAVRVSKPEMKMSNYQAIYEQMLAHETAVYGGILSAEQIAELARVEAQAIIDREAQE